MRSGGEKFAHLVILDRYRPQFFIFSHQFSLRSDGYYNIL